MPTIEAWLQGAVDDVARSSQPGVRPVLEALAQAAAALRAGGLERRRVPRRAIVAATASDAAGPSWLSRATIAELARGLAARA